MSRTPLAVLGLAAGAAGFALFAAAGAGVWSLKAAADRKAADLAARAATAADAADHALGFVVEVVDRAEAELAAAKSVTPAGPPEQVNPFLQLTARSAAQQLAGSVDRVHGAVVAASDAVKIADAALDVAGQYPELKSLFGVTPAQLDATRATLGSVAGELRQAKTVLGFPVADTSAVSREQLNAAEEALRQARALAGSLGQVVGSARQRVADLKASADVWGRRVALGVTAASALAAVGQVFMVRFFWRVLRRRPA
ncbi:MAG: hypothetical protein C0501_03530 [Isosphaera sp.]|nr:hypothetical protein [Isosphaera sp.]